MNAIYGVEAWNFGSRTLKGRTGVKRALDKTASQVKAELPTSSGAEGTTAVADAAAVDLTQPVASPVKRLPSKKGGGVRKNAASRAAGKKSGIVHICRDCGQVTPKAFIVKKTAKGKKKNRVFQVFTVKRKRREQQQDSLHHQES